MRVEKVRTQELFSTPVFQDSPWIAGLCAKAPELWVCHDEEVPGHFGTYFGCTYLRLNAYKNPYIRDLYFLHEIDHAQRFDYSPRESFSHWALGMADNEMHASLTSECEVYLRIPGLRAKTFPHEIWVDRFAEDVGLDLRDASCRLGDREIADVCEDLVARRLDALHSPAPGDFHEAQIWNYGRQNIDWCRLWSEVIGEGIHGDKAAFRAVEEHMSDPGRDETHLEWLEEVSCVEFGRGRVPFRRQALAFEHLYKASGVRYGNHILAR